VTLRSLAEDGEIQVDFGSNHGAHAYLQYPFIRLPSAPIEPGEDDLRQVRAAADAAAMRVRYHDATSYQQYLPEEEKARAIYDALEQARVESLGARQFEGLAHNIAHRTQQRCQSQGYTEVSERSDPPLGELLGLMLREKLCGTPPPQEMSALLKLWQPSILQQIGKDGLEDLARHAHDPADFAKTLSHILHRLGLSAESAAPQEDDQEHEDEPHEEGHSPDDDHHDDQQDEGDQEPMPSPEDVTGEVTTEEDELSLEDTDNRLEAQNDEDGEGLYIPNLRMPHFHYTASDYHAYTTRHDEVIGADELLESKELRQLRQKLDLRLSEFATLTAKLSNRLMRLLMARQRRRWLFEQEEGVLDSAKLARLISTPNYPYYYKQEVDTEFRDTVVTLLLDNSGSMRGRPITVAAMSSDILARTLERCGIKVEILGFTTCDWKGGQSRKQWIQDGSPMYERGPGRLNDLRHIIYKTADTPLRRARHHLGLMLKDGILKENIDGESILWAHQRLINRPEQRKILMVISDGAPVDDSTLSVNHSGYLDAHLREVIAMIEHHSSVELTAIGIGHDVTRYYQRAITIPDVDQLADTMIREVGMLFTETQASA